MRRGRYRKNWLTPAECKTWAPAFRPHLHLLLQERSTANWSQAEFVARYLELGFTVAGLLQKGSHWQAPLALQISDGPLALWSHTLFRGLPLSVNRSLLAWHHGLFPLHLCEHAPSTEEVLHWQTQSERCVTCVTDEQALSSYILGERDPLSFVLHDLIHADHFFQDPLMAQVQVGFSRLMFDLTSQPLIQSLRCEDPIFCREFDYGATDMNSHGAHLLKYLKAVIVFALERRGHSSASSLLIEILTAVQIPELIQSCFLRLNTPDETVEDFQELQNFLRLRLSQNEQILYQFSNLTDRALD